MVSFNVPGFGLATVPVFGAPSSARTCELNLEHTALFPRYPAKPSPTRAPSIHVGKVIASAASKTPLLETSTTVVRQWFRSDDVPSQAVRVAEEIFGSDNPVQVDFEICFNVELTGDDDAAFGDMQNYVLEWLLAETFDPKALSASSKFADASSAVVEVGPRLNFQTAWSANAVAICGACGLANVARLERSRRYRLIPGNQNQVLDRRLVAAFAARIHDRMTETVYSEPLRSFDTGLKPESTWFVPLLERGKVALEQLNAELGLGFDEYDLDLYMSLFVDRMKRNPTNVELFDMAQSNSEHSRHWFFKGQLVIDGERIPSHLFSIVRETLLANPQNSVIAFADNSSTIRGGPIPLLLPASPGFPSQFVLEHRDRDVLFTAETHNFPSGVAPFPGAETGAGGRIRDTAATGIGSIVVAGTAGYAVGNLAIPGMRGVWEDDQFGYPDNLASPLQILIEASNGASDYGNKFGEPVINGYARSYGVRLHSGERREYVKPIMFSGGMGQMDNAHSRKGSPEIGHLVVKIGGPAYRIGMGGGAASSMMQGDNRVDLDFNAVQRGDAEMEQKAYRVLRACVEMGKDNPIVSIHDQGAGGNCNVVKELIYPAGAKIELRNVWIGDSSLSALEIWGAEYQEQFGLLLRQDSWDLFVAICERENIVPAMLGHIDGSGRIVLWDRDASRAVVDLDLEAVLGDLPQKTFVDFRAAADLLPLNLPDQSVTNMLENVLTLMTVGSKRFLTTKVDRSVTGLVAQQQCVGPLQLPLSDAGVIARTYFSLLGSATAIGERPSLTLISPCAMARMTVGEMLTNLGSVKVTAREDIKCEGNWMWAAKLPGDGASLYDAAVAMRDVMIELGIAIDGGKDSLSMAARCPIDGSENSLETVRAPGTLVITGYSTVEDINLKLTPDLKRAGGSVLLHVDIAKGRRRLGGSCLAQVYRQLGNECPDVDDVDSLIAAFDTVQGLIASGSLLSYHDISDGGLIVCLLEMAFGGNCGIDISIPCREDVIGNLFAEELGMLLEVEDDQATSVIDYFGIANVPCFRVGISRADFVVTVVANAVTVLHSDVRQLRDTWERTSFALERLQANPACVEQEQSGLSARSGPNFVVPWIPKQTPDSIISSVGKHKIAIIREEGSNGDREMTAAFYMAGFEPWDVAVRDIASGRVTLSDFRGAAFVGGFSYADVLDSAKGWAGVIRFNDAIRSEFDGFYARQDTFSLGVCNGCQLMALLGRVPFSPDELPTTSQPRFIRNKSGRYESRFSTIAIEGNTPSILLKGMGGAKIGVWCAHGEGRAYFPDTSVLGSILSDNLAPIRYVDDSGEVATQYPFNPNGSEKGIAGLCSRNGRHLAMMPHPERSVLTWQWGYMPADLRAKLGNVSPWLTMFQNARTWCDEN
jgi:phosphoribosylformylglycinamidine synthase